jgi:hypothetical protein
MKEKAAVATVEGKAYFLIVNELKEQNIPFISLVPGEAIPAEVKAVITTEKEKPKVKHEKTLIFQSEKELDVLVNEVKRILIGKDVYERIIIGVDPGEAVGLAVVADGKVIVEGNCYSIPEVINTTTKTVRNVDFSKTSVTIKMGNGVPLYKDLLEELDGALPSKVGLEVVNEAGTNKPLKENGHSRGIRHISSAIRIAGRSGHIFPRRKHVAANNQTR